MKRLLVLTAAELSRDPRGRRAALAGRLRGLDVVGLCSQVATDVPGTIEGVEIARVHGDRVTSSLRRAGFGGMRRSPPIVRELRGFYRGFRLAGLSWRLARAGRSLGRFDLVHANDFDTLPAAWWIARRSRGRLVYDSHELYTTQEPDPPRVFQRVVGAIEGALARRAAAVVTTGEPFAGELNRRFRLRRPALVWLNCPERVDVTPSQPSVGPLRAIYQAAMGPGRPLEDVLAAAETTGAAELTLRVVGADTEQLARQIAERGLEGRVRLAAPVPPTELVQALAEFEVGLIINRPVTMTDELVVPNKLFEYMMAGLAPVVPRLPGLTPIVEENGVGAVFEPGDPASLAAALDSLAADRDGLARMRRRARELALERFNAEEQIVVLDHAWGL